MAILTFHGAAGTVTGSQFLLEARGERLLVDCGMFQGLKELRELNWKPPQFEARRLRWVVLTHAHMDHAGWLPRLYKEGFRGRVFATRGTTELSQLLLMDSARLQEEDAFFHNRKGTSKHAPALPLYEEADARNVLRCFETVAYERWKKLTSHISFRFINVGHLLGSAMVEVRIEGDEDQAIMRGSEEADPATTEETPLPSVARAGFPSLAAASGASAIEPDGSAVAQGAAVARGNSLAHGGAGARESALMPGSAAAERDAATQGKPLAHGTGGAEMAALAQGISLAQGSSEAEESALMAGAAVAEKSAVAQGSALAEVDPAEQAAAEMLLARRPRPLTVLFSGDVGRYAAPLAPDPSPPVPCDVLVIESTYGNRPHDEGDLGEELAKIAEATFARRGVLLIPAFAVGRSQQVLFLFHELFEKGRLPRMPIHMDSPMAVDATEIYARHPGELDPWKGARSGEGILGGPNIVFHRTQEESKRLNSFTGPGVIISSSGMLTGGRILHHLALHMSDARNTILLVGFQAAGTRGRALAEGATYLRFHGKEFPLRAEVRQLHGLSGHADARELLRWTSDLPAPRQVFVTHGEPEAAEALADTLRRERGWSVTVPSLHQTFKI